MYDDCIFSLYINIQIYFFLVFNILKLKYHSILLIFLMVIFILSYISDLHWKSNKIWYRVVLLIYLKIFEKCLFCFLLIFQCLQLSAENQMGAIVLWKFQILIILFLKYFDLTWGYFLFLLKATRANYFLHITSSIT